MQFRGDRRGQAIQVGAVLLLGAIVLTFSIYQATVVPEQNREIEFKHSQTVQDQLTDVRNAVLSTGSTGDGRSTSVTLGTQYPARIIALNPSPPSGTLATVGTTEESVNVTVANARAGGETGDFWTGTNRSYNTGALVYRPGYNEYQGAPTTWYENSVLFDRFSDANLTVTDQRLVDGDRISLVTLNGSYSKSRSGTEGVDLRGVSTSSRTVSVTNETEDSNVIVTVPSRLERSDWVALLDDEEHVANVTTTTLADAEYDLIHVILERGVTYDLQVTRVGVGTKVVRPKAAYLTRQSGATPTVPEGGQVDLTVEVRDALDNPKTDVRVIAGTRWDNASVAPTNVTSDDEGQVTVTYDAPADISGASQRTDHVQVSLNTSLSGAVNGSSFDGSTAVNVTVPVRVDNSDGSGLGGGGSATPSAGQGGESTYTPVDSTELLTDENGIWRSINRTDQIIFGGGYPVIDPTNSDEYVLTEFTIANASERYSVTMEAFRTTGNSYDGSVDIYRFETDNQQSLSLTPAAAQAVLEADQYNGTDILNRDNYDSTDSTFVAYQRQITQMDGSRTAIILSDQDGRVNMTLQGEALFSAIEPDPSTANDEDEFVQLFFENETNTGGWTFADGDSTVSLPDERLQGIYYFTKNKATFESNHPSVPSARVYEMNLGLDNAGEALTLRDAQGDLRDEVAYGGQQTRNGWSLTLGTDEVGNRTTYPDGVYVDTDRASDWDVETESEFFGTTTAAESITYNSDGTADGPGGEQSGVSFSVTNTGSSSVTITDIAIDSSGDAGELLEKNDGSGQWNREVYIDATTPGSVETGDGGNDEYTLGTGPVGFTSNPALDGGTMATISLYQFTESGSGNSGGPVNMNGESVTVTLTFGDESTKMITFTG
jgi:hypothetical protein